MTWQRWRVAFANPSRTSWDVLVEGLDYVDVNAPTVDEALLVARKRHTSGWAVLSVVVAPSFSVIQEVHTPSDLMEPVNNDEE